MEFCSANESVASLWIDHGFNHCFLFTIYSIALGSLMIIVGSLEISMYSRFASRTDKELLGATKFSPLYILQLVGNVLLILFPVAQLIVNVTALERPLFGFTILYAVARIFIWTFALALVQVERFLELPSPPAWGHSLFLVFFWAVAFIFQNLTFVNFNGSYWYFLVHNHKEEVDLGLFCFEYALVLLQFILGLRAPGLPSLKQRRAFLYRRMSRSYGSLSDEDVGLQNVEANESLVRLRSQLWSGELAKEFDAQFGEAEDKPSASLVAANVSATVTQENAAISFTEIVMSSPDYISSLHYTALNKSVTQVQTRELWKLVYARELSTIVTFADRNDKGSNFWPAPNQYDEFDGFLISCIHERKVQTWFSTFKKPLCILREFSLVHLDTHRELNIFQLQFEDLSQPKVVQQLANVIFDVRGKSSFGSTKNVLVSSCLNESRRVLQNTALFVILDTALHLVRKEATVSPLQLLRCLSSQLHLPESHVLSKDLFLSVCSAVVRVHEKYMKKY